MLGKQRIWKGSGLKECKRCRATTNVISDTVISFWVGIVNEYEVFGRLQGRHKALNGFQRGLQVRG